MYRGLIGTALLNETGMHTQVAGQFGGGQHLLVGYDGIALAVVEHPDDAAIVHRPACKVAHTFARALAIEVSAFERRQCGSDAFHLADGRQGFDSIVHQVGNVDGDVATIALGPTVLPEITGYFRYLVDFFFQGRTAL